MREMNQDDAVHKNGVKSSDLDHSKLKSQNQHEFSLVDQQSIPLNNKDVIARAK